MTALPSRLDARHVARLAVLRRLGMGTAHAMNNALTAAMGEACFLLEDYKGEPAVAEACQAILTSIDRCARLSQAYLARNHPGQSADGEVDLVRLVRDLEGWLDEAIGSRQTLTIEAPDELVLVAGDIEDLELLVLALVAFAIDAVGGADLTLRVKAAGAPSLELFAWANEMPAGLPDRIREPQKIEDPLSQTLLLAVHEVVGSARAELDVVALAPAGFRVRIAFPAAPAADPGGIG